jgi:hypothetical protein
MSLARFSTVACSGSALALAFHAAFMLASLRGRRFLLIYPAAYRALSASRLNPLLLPLLCSNIIFLQQPY